MPWRVVLALAGNVCGPTGRMIKISLRIVKKKERKTVWVGG